jgi:hypothetical protein
MKTKSLVCLVRVLDLFLWCPILVLVLGILEFVRKGDVPLGKLVVEMAGNQMQIKMPQISFHHSQNGYNQKK